MSHTRLPSTSTRAGDSTSKTSISSVSRQAAELHLRRHRLYLQHQQLRRRPQLQQQPRLQLHPQPPSHRVLRLQLRQGPRPLRALTRAPGLGPRRCQGPKAEESWFAFLKPTADRQIPRLRRQQRQPLRRRSRRGKPPRPTAVSRPQLVALIRGIPPRTREPNEFCVFGIRLPESFRKEFGSLHCLSRQTSMPVPCQRLGYPACFNSWHC
jgi:hypothetical protein